MRPSIRWALPTLRCGVFRHFLSDSVTQFERHQGSYGQRDFGIQSTLTTRVRQVRISNWRNPSKRYRRHEKPGVKNHEAAFPSNPPV
jgi:hypothetical protein